MLNISGAEYLINWVNQFELGKYTNNVMWIGRYIFPQSFIHFSVIFLFLLLQTS